MNAGDTTTTWYNTVAKPTSTEENNEAISTNTKHVVTPKRDRKDLSNHEIIALVNEEH